MKSTLFSPQGWAEGLLSAMLVSLLVGAVCLTLLLLFNYFWPSRSASSRYICSFLALFTTFLSFLFMIAVSMNSNATSSISLQSSMFVMDELSAITNASFSWSKILTEGLVWGYLIGIGLQSALLLQSFNRIQLLQKSSGKDVPESWQKLLHKTQSLLKVRRTIRFKVSEFVSSPSVIGFFKPLVLFPVATVNQLSLNQVEAILIHELSHIRRNDYFWNWVKAIIQALLFFNPFVWVLVQLLDEERECACDDRVLRHMGKPVFYAQTLLHLAQLPVDRPVHGVALSVLGGQKSQLFNRISRITNLNDMKSKPKFIQQRFLFLGLAIGIGLFLSSFRQVSTMYINEDVSEVSKSMQNPVSEDRKETLEMQQPSHQHVNLTNQKVAEDSVQTLKIFRTDAKGNHLEIDSAQKRKLIETYSQQFKNFVTNDSLFIKGTMLRNKLHEEFKAFDFSVDSAYFKAFKLNAGKMDSLFMNQRSSMNSLKMNSKELKRLSNIIMEKSNLIYKLDSLNLKSIDSIKFNSFKFDFNYNDFFAQSKKAVQSFNIQQLELIKGLLDSSIPNKQSMNREEKELYNKILKDINTLQKSTTQ